MLETRAVRRLLVISSDPVVAAELAAVGVEVVPDVTDGLNAALSHGAALLRAADPGAAVGALQADLPALRPGELDAALHDAAALFATGTRRAFCPDAQGTGTTLLLAAAGVRRSTRASAPGRRRATARPAPFPLPRRGRGCAATSTPATTCARPPSWGWAAHPRGAGPDGPC